MTRTSRVNRNLAGQVGSGRVGSGRVGSGRVLNPTGQVGLGQELFKFHGPGRIGSGGFFLHLTGRVDSGQEVSTISRVRSGQVRTFIKFRVSGRIGSAETTRPDPT